jgi:hypothetical protein
MFNLAVEMGREKTNGVRAGNCRRARAANYEDEAQGKGGASTESEGHDNNLYGCEDKGHTTSLTFICMLLLR